jgi:prophage tail gpP-like protein
MAINIISATINNKTYTSFISYNIDIDLESLVNIFELIVSVPDDEIINIGDRIQIKVDNEELIDGFIERVSESDSNYGNLIKISGRDRLGDLVDSKVGAKIYKPPMDFITLCKNVLETINFKVVPIKRFIGYKSNEVSIINKYGLIDKLGSEDDISHRDGDSAFEVIKRCADKRGLILTTDGFSNLVINDIGEDRCNTILQRVIGGSENNIIQSSVDRDWTHRFHKYIVKSTAGNGDGGAMEIIEPLPINSDRVFTTKVSRQNYGSFVNTQAETIDSEVRETRTHYHHMSMTSTRKAVARAKWEANIQKTKSFTYSCEIYGFRQNLNENIKFNPLWKVNNLVDVWDERRRVFGSYLIKSINYSKTNENGTTTLLQLVDKYAYTDSLFEPISERIRGRKRVSNKPEKIL